MTDIDLLRGDCSRCFGLCCVALSFERGPLFAFDKPAGEPCPNLTQQGRCAVHERLAAAGMTGCARSDCLGAGQLATEMFAAVERCVPRNARVFGLAFARLVQIQTMRLLIRRTRPAGATELAMRLEAATSATLPRIPRSTAISSRSCGSSRPCDRASPGEWG